DKPEDEKKTPAANKDDKNPKAEEDEEETPDESASEDEEDKPEESAEEQDGEDEDEKSVAEKSAQIVEACAAAGKAEMAATFIRKGATVQEVKDQMDIQSQI